MRTPQPTPWPMVLLSLTAAGVAAVLTGCSHGDAIIFASNKQIGVKVGVDSQKIPEVSIGYNGQDFALVPVYKKDAKPQASSTGGADPGAATQPRELSEVGKYLATSGANDKDAYSVYGSFVGKAEGSVTPQKTGASLGLSQFFATGIAAQMLAKDAGAAMVNPLARGTADAQAAEAEAEVRAAEAKAQAAPHLNEVNRRKSVIVAYVTNPDGSLNSDLLKTLAGETANEKAITEAASTLDVPGLQKKLDGDWAWDVDDLYRNLPEPLRKKP